MIAGPSLLFSNDSYQILLCLCHYGPALLGRQNSASFFFFFKVQAGKIFYYHGHALITLYSNFYVLIGQDLTDEFMRKIMQHLESCLGADHLTLEGVGGGGDIWSSRIFFSSNLVGRIFFSLFFSHKHSITFVLHAIFFFRQALAGNFFSSHSPLPLPSSPSRVKWSAPYFNSWSWQSFVSTCDVFHCVFPLNVQNEIQLLSRVFCYSWLVCLLGFCLRNESLVKIG